MGYEARYKKIKPEVERAYKGIGTVRCPYFSDKINFTSDGFHHLRYSAGSERLKKVQLLKFGLIHSAVSILEKSGTIQEYRKQWGRVGRKKSKDGSQNMKEIQYWGFVAIVDGEDARIRVRVVVRKIGKGSIHFWSVMPHSRLKEKDSYKLASDNVLDE